VSARRALTDLRPPYQRDVEATRLVAATCTRLPVDAWQRRFAARAFGAPLLPPVDRDWSGGAALRRASAGPPLFILATSRACWALSPGGRHRLDEAARALALAKRPEFVAVVALVADRRDAPRHVLQGPRPLALRDAALGVLDWADAADVFTDLLTYAPTPDVRARVNVAVTWLEVLRDECAHT